MKLKKSNRIAAVLFALALGVSGNALAAQADTEAISDADLEAAVADIPDDMFADVPKDHWAYEALDTLAQKGIIDGYADGTFQGNRSMSRYEMAAIIAKARNSGAIGNADLVDQAILEMLEDEYKADLKPIKAEITEMKKEMAKIKAGANNQPVKLSGFFRTSWTSDYERNKGGDPYAKEKEHNRFQLVLNGDAKLNDNAALHFEIDTKRTYARNYDGSMGDERNPLKTMYIHGKTPGGADYWLGRRWAQLGFNFTMMGCEVDGVQADWAVKGTGLRAGAFYWAQREYAEADATFWGPYIRGPIGHNFEVMAAFAKVSGGKYRPDSRWDNGGEIGNIDKVAQDVGQYYGDKVWMFGMATNVAKNLRLTADYVKTNHSNADAAATDYYHTSNPRPSDPSDQNKSWTVKLEYKWTNPSVKGSFGAYARYHNLGRNGAIWSGTEWDVLMKNSKGWSVGFKYVPWNNVLWSTDFGLMEANTALQGAYNSDTYNRRIIRTSLDFYF